MLWKKDDLLDDRRKFFKHEFILVDKKDYKDVQNNIRNYKCMFDNMLEFNPKLELNEELNAVQKHR